MRGWVTIVVCLLISVSALADVFAGEVWLCTGLSSMGFPLKSIAGICGAGIDGDL
jgi:hypothetical protein